jgi:hypothetical protein
MRIVYKRKILITLPVADKCSMTSRPQEMPHWREKCESFQVDRCRCIEGRCLHQIRVTGMPVSAKSKVTKTKTVLKQITYNLSDLKLDHDDLYCGFVES